MAIEQQTFKIQTRNITAQLLLRLSSMGVTASLQDVGRFIDASSAKIAEASANYYLSRISQGRAISTAAVNKQVHNLVTHEMCRSIPSLTPDQVEKARVAVLQTIMTSYTQQYPSDVGQWENCRLVSLTPTDYIINASRQTRQDAAANMGYGGVRGFGDSWQGLARAA